MILCDIGNTTYHFKDGKKDFKLDLKTNLKKIKIKDRIYFISVNKKGTKKLLKLFPNAINLEKYFTLKTNYSNKIGIDRVVACSDIKNSIVVDFGSAITVDIIKDSKHLGGFIMPGVDILKRNYPEISSKLKFEFENNLNLDKIPTNTDMAINYAIINMIVLPIKKVQNRYNLKIIFTGQNSELFLNYFQNSKFKSNLIFKNMKKAVRKL